MPSITKLPRSTRGGVSAAAVTAPIQSPLPITAASTAIVLRIVHSFSLMHRASSEVERHAPNTLPPGLPAAIAH
jgi:hypothetical protein